MFKVRIPDNINRAGWHVAHLFDVKNRDVEIQNWDRNEFVGGLFAIFTHVTTSIFQSGNGDVMVGTLM